MHVFVTIEVANGHPLLSWQVHEHELIENAIE
jgi:hypothetical protein